MDHVNTIYESDLGYSRLSPVFLLIVKNRPVPPRKLHIYHLHFLTHVYACLHGSKEPMLITSRLDGPSIYCSLTFMCIY